jgi:hypothetical protein
VYSDPVDAFNELMLFERSRLLSRRADKAQVLRDQYVENLDARQKEVTALTAEAEVLREVNELFKALLDKLVLGQVQTIEGVVTEGLRAVFYDQELTLESEVSQKYHKIHIDFFLRQGAKDGIVIRGKPLESFGGGPASVASLVIRAMTLLRLKKWPILLLDETMAAVSDDYVEQMGAFLRKLAQSAKIDVLLVTHKQAYLENANVAYQGTEELAEDGSWALALRRLRVSR